MLSLNAKYYYSSIFEGRPRSMSNNVSSLSRSRVMFIALKYSQRWSLMAYSLIYKTGFMVI